MSGIIKVLVVDDSATARQVLSQIIHQTSDLKVVGEAQDGTQAISMAAQLRPDIILMDLIMPRMSGLEATREIMRRTPTPIVVVSASLDSSETQIAFDAISAGALSAIQKPVGPHSPAHNEQVSELLFTLRAMAGVAVIHHWTPKHSAHRSLERPMPSRNFALPRIVGVVSSTGGPTALADVFKSIPADFPLPIAVVQHIAADFVTSLQVWLSSVSALKVVIAEAGGSPRPGHIYLAPGNVHLTISPQEVFELNPDRFGEQHVPSGNVFLTSVARTYKEQAIGVILTGMGGDGAAGMRLMYEAGAYTIAQDEASCVVYGMPKEAADSGAVRQVVPLLEIADVLISLTKPGSPGGSPSAPPAR